MAPNLNTNVWVVYCVCYIKLAGGNVTAACPDNVVGKQAIPRTHVPEIRNKLDKSSINAKNKEFI